MFVRNAVKTAALILAAVMVGAGLLEAAEKTERTMKNAVAFYSYSGNTEVAGRTLAAELSADVVKVEDVQRPSTLKAYISGAYAARKGKAWPIQPVQVNMAGYDRVFIGAPVWWGRPAPEINAFIDQTDLAGKEVVVFATMGGSDAKGALQMLTSRIEAKGGKVVSSFSIKTGGVNRAGIEAKAKEIAAQYMSR